MNELIMSRYAGRDILLCACEASLLDEASSAAILFPDSETSSHTNPDFIKAFSDKVDRLWRDDDDTGYEIFKIPENATDAYLRYEFVGTYCKYDWISTTLYYVVNGKIKWTFFGEDRSEKEN